MGAFRYQAVEASGNPVSGMIEADDRRSALQLLSTRGIFAREIEECAADGKWNSARSASGATSASPTTFTGIRRKLVTVVLPKLFSMLKDMAKVLPLPTVILLNVSAWLNHYWPIALVALVAIIVGGRWYLKSPKGALTFDRLKLRAPVIGPVFLSSA